MSVSFSATFPIKLRQLSRALIGYKNNPNMTLSEKISVFGVGKNAVEGITSVLKKSNLLEKSRKIVISDLGKLILNYDLYFEDLGTKWIIHYNLSSDFSRYGAEVYAYLINRYIQRHKKFDLKDAKKHACSFSFSSFNIKGIEADVTVCLEALIDKEAFGELKILNAINKDKFKVNVPERIPVLVFAYILYDWLQKNIISYPTMQIERVLSEDGNVGKIFLLNRSRLLGILNALQSENVITIIQSGDYDSIGFTFQQDHYEFLKEYYRSTRKY